MKKYVFEDKTGERYTVKANNEQNAWTKFSQQMDYAKDDMDLMVEEFTLKTVDPMPSASPQWFQHTSVNKTQCEEYNGIWVNAYHKSNGIFVQSYCRKR